MLETMNKITPLRATLGASRQALLASPSRGEVKAALRHNAFFTLPLEGMVAKLGSESRSAAREGVSYLPQHTVERF
jgi:hypothetical protein